MLNKKIILATDHAGFKLKEKAKEYLVDAGMEVEDMGAYALNPQDDYPDFIVPAAKKIAKEGIIGIIFGASGQGESIAANKVKGIRAALYYGKNIEILKLSRTHNDSNILSLGSKFLTKEEAIEAIKLWLKTDFSNDERHIRRIKKISNL